MPVTVRLWASARTAVGRAEVTVGAAATLADVLAALRRDPGGADLDRLLAGCSFLVDERPVGGRPPESVPLTDGAVVDVLPPFAGG